MWRLVGKIYDHKIEKTNLLHNSKCVVPVGATCNVNPKIDGKEDVQKRYYGARSNE